MAINFATSPYKLAAPGIMNAGHTGKPASFSLCSLWFDQPLVNNLGVNLRYGSAACVNAAGNLCLPTHPGARCIGVYVNPGGSSTKLYYSPNEPVNICYAGEIWVLSANSGIDYRLGDPVKFVNAGVTAGYFIKGDNAIFTAVPGAVFLSQVVHGLLLIRLS